MSHTPGPWRARAGSGGRPSIIYGHDGWPVADVTTYHGRTADERQEANARLIAAAPELLAALQTAACPQGDGWATVTIMRVEEKSTEKYTAKCSTASAALGCYLDKDFEKKPFAKEENKCNTTLPFPLPKIVK